MERVVRDGLAFQMGETRTGFGTARHFCCDDCHPNIFRQNQLAASACSASFGYPRRWKSRDHQMCYAPSEHNALLPSWAAARGLKLGTEPT